MKPKIRRKNAFRRIGPGGPGIRLHEKIHPSKQRAKGKLPKPAKLTQRAMLKQALEKAGLHKTKGQRVSERKNFKAVFGYEQPRLSMAVGRKVGGKIKPGKASRYRVKGKRLIYEVKKEWKPGESVARTDMWGSIRRDMWGDPIYDYEPGGEVVVGKKLVGEKLVVKRLSKKGSGKKGSSRGEGVVRYGSAASVRGMVKKAKTKRKKMRGGRTKKEKKKKKSKKRKR